MNMQICKYANMQICKYANMTNLAKELFKAFDVEFDKNGWSIKANKLFKDVHEEAAIGGFKE